MKCFQSYKAVYCIGLPLTFCLKALLIPSNIPMCDFILPELKVCKLDPPSIAIT